jgi:SH3-like domain-containing protein
VATIEPDVLTRRIDALRAEVVQDPRLAVWDVSVVTEDTASRVTGWITVESALERIGALAREAGFASVVRLLPDPALGAEVAAVAHRSLAHLRREPRHAAELVTQLVLGEEAIVLRAHEEWLQVQTVGGYVGWTHRASVVRRVPAEGVARFRERLAAHGAPPDTWVVTTRSPVARRKPAPDAPVACDLVRGAWVVTAGERDDWLEIELPDGLTGWIPRDHALPRERLPERFPREGASVVAHAAEYIGLPYLWGGTSEKGFDCSGLIQRIYGLHGVALPRDSDQQARVGALVPRADWNDVEEGDLAFFAETPGGRATHVGILSMGGRMIHASTSRNGVAWDALRPGLAESSDYGARLAERLTAIRRVFR